MPFVYKTLGQAAPTDTNNVNIYTVPSDTEAIVSSIVVSGIVCRSGNESVQIMAYVMPIFNCWVRCRLTNTGQERRVP